MATAARAAGRRTGGTAPAAATTGNRERILEAAAEEFSRRGFHGTTARLVARRARVSVGNLYNHFRGMRELFTVLLRQEEERYFSAESPLQRVFATLSFPEDLEKLGAATRENVRTFARYLRLIYVDVLEFDGKHIARLFNDLRARYQAVHGPALAARQRRGELGPVDPVTALMASSLLFFNYFAVEELFGGQRHYGCSHDAAIAEICRLLRYGILPRK